MTIYTVTDYPYPVVGPDNLTRPGGYVRVSVLDGSGDTVIAAKEDLTATYTTAAHYKLSEHAALSAPFGASS